MAEPVALSWLWFVRLVAKARNPRTGDGVKVPAKLVVTFKAGREMGERVGRLKELPNGKA